MSAHSHNLGWVAAASGGQLTAGAPTTEVLRVVTDSRIAGPGDLFVALSGPNFDGHSFLPDVAARGAAGALVSRGGSLWVPPGLPAVTVEDPKRAYNEIARAHRALFAAVVCCIAGSNGKTTTKEILAALLGTAGPTLKSEASFNNDVGVPHTLLRLDSSHWAAVLEAGTNHPGELRPLVDLIQPRYGILTSVGREHLEFFSDLEGVAAEEGALAEVLPQDGLLVLPADAPFADAIAARARCRVVRLGGVGISDWAAAITGGDWRGMNFQVGSPIPGWSGPWHVSLPGRHSVSNALAAMVVAAELGIEPLAARRALATFAAPRQRLNATEINGVWLLDDTYNANPDSMGAALQTLSDLPCAGRRVAVLGDMAELGGHAETAHGEVGSIAARAVDALFTVGRFADVTCRAARAAGLAAAVACADAAAAEEAVMAFVRPGDSVLVKASRSARLERITNSLKEHLQRLVPA